MARSIRYAIQRKRAEQRLAYLEQYDDLTGFANRALFQERLKQVIARGDREDSNMIAVMLLSLDRFKAVNAQFGHSCGDAVLKAVAGRIGDCVNEGATVARVGGDEFCLIVEDVEEIDAAISLVAEILGSFEQPFIVDGREVSVNASIGIASRPPSMGNRLLQEAELAVARVKEQGGNAYQFYTEEMNVRAFERLTLESNLRRALKRDEYELYYQPKVDLRTGRVFGAEALLRWRHPDMGIVSPVNFVPVLEETGFIVEVGEWALRTACRQARRWADGSFGPLQVAVNISARQFREEGLTETINGCLREGGLDPRCLELEVTESLIMEDPETSRDMLERLKSEKGIRVSIDDFGTGYSSLSYLKLFPLDLLKIDKSFVRDIPDDPDDAAIVSAMIGLSHNLGLKVLAEGVETREQLKFLCERGCDQAQGYLFSHPLPAEDLTALLKSNDTMPGFKPYSGDQNS